MNYKNVAEEIFNTVGANNISGVSHCATRLRLRVLDSKKVDFEKLNSIPEAHKVVQRENDIQVVIGNEIYEVYDEFVKLSGDNFALEDDSSPSESVEADGGKKDNKFISFVNTISECISPILPALIASGLCSAVASVIRATEVIDLESTTFQVISAFGAAPMYFLPFFLAVGAATRLKVSPYISMVIAALILYPNLTALIGGETQAVFLGIPIINVTYSQSIIPILLAVWLQTIIEPFLSKKIPSSLRTMLLPFLEFVVIGLATLLVLGPIAGVLTDGIAAVLTPLSANYAWLVVALLGSLNVFLVGTGLHHGILPIAVTNFALLGYDNIIGPAMFVTTFSLAGTCLGYAVKTRNSKMKQVAVSSGLASLMGITEPGIYGLLFVNKKSLISCMITGLIGGVIMGASGVRVWALGPKGVTGFALLAGPEFVIGVVGCVICLIIGFVLSYIIGEDKMLVENSEK